MNNKLRNTGYINFFLSGICAISSGVIVAILQEKYGLTLSVTGTLLSVMSIGNMLASFICGLLPSVIGARRTVLILGCGYFVGYMAIGLSGFVGVLILAFLMIGIAKGCALNNCTVLVGNNAPNRAVGMSLMHACYAFGALLCPFVISIMSGFGDSVPMFFVALIGLLMIIIFAMSGISNEKGKNDKKEKIDFSFMKDKKFWLLTGLVFCQNAAETSVTGWLVTYYRNLEILSGKLSTYTVTIMWGATLIARLLIVFVFNFKDTFKAVSIMGLFCTILYGCLVITKNPIIAVVMLFCFAFAMAGVNPMAVAGVGEKMSVTSMGVMLPLAGIGAIVMPWIIGIVGEIYGLQMGMACNLIPCFGIMVLSARCRKY